MSQLFIHDESNAWSVLELSGDVYRLSRSSQFASQGPSPGPISRPRVEVFESYALETASRSGAVILRRTGESGVGRATGCADSNAEWAVLAGTDTPLRINGAPVSVGIAALRHRDELRLEGSSPLYFSTERLVSVETYREEDAPRCPRCTLSIAVGDAYVNCPSCNVLHHQLPDRECWTYTPTCALCDQASDLTTGYRWSPEDL